MKNAIETIGLIRNELELPIAAPRRTVWKALVEDVDSWWQPDFYFTAEPRKVTLEAIVGGRLFEQSDDGSGLLWYTVVALKPEESITLAGVLAPPYAGPATATLHLALESRADDRTLFLLSESVWGHIGDNLKTSLESGWRQLFDQGLRSYVEAS